MSTSGKRLYALALALFWGLIFLFTLLDYLGDRWVEISFGSTPLLIVPLVVALLVAGGLLLAAAIRMMMETKSVWLRVIVFLFCLATGAVNFFLYVVFMLWYQFDFMHRPL
jgi:hypothetical protein